ncbi:LysR family transcriptional regulator [Castellaniella sp.]|uniref:LysR family transcriptional regulator n=1 Tax=Castellaniella sp. TaxID=1955812 RepID=UPI002AFF7AE4|nr:LysR family transcriptional regulator [Castellaniella sp.]
MSPSLNDLELFVEVARSQGFTRAGDALGMPASTLSRRISQLEKSIGVRLLNRSTRKVVLTDVGVAYFERCRHIIEEARIAHEALLDDARQPRGHLRVSLPSSLALAFLQDALPEFSRRYPDIDCEYDLSVRKIDLQADGFDVVIRASRLPDSGIVSRRLGTLSLGLYASGEYLRRHGVPAEPADLSGHQCLRASASREDSLWKLLSSGGEERQVRVDGRIAVNHVMMLRYMVERHMGIVPLSVPPDQRKGSLVRVLPDWSFEAIPMVALFPSRMMPARARALLDFLNEQLAHVDILGGGSTVE